VRHVREAELIEPGLWVVEATQGQQFWVDQQFFEPSTHPRCEGFIPAENNWYAHLNGKHRWNGVRYNWWVGNNHYRIFLHQALVGINNVDHIDRNVWNNRMDNLRDGTNIQMKNIGLRSDNTSGFIGVSWAKPYNRWEAKIRIDGPPKNLGYYNTAEEAARAVDRKVIELGWHLLGRQLNFPLETHETIEQ
jgi:hypothetical protein